MSKSTIMKLGFIGLTSLSSNLAMAYPVSEINCQHILRDIKLPAGVSSTQLLFGEACESIYVAPPKAGIKEAKLEVAQTTNLRDCPAVLNLSTVKLNLTRQMVALSEESARIAERLSRLQIGLDTKASQLASKSEYQSEIEEQIKTYKLQVQVLQEETLNLEDQLSQCGRLYCSDIRSQIKEKKKQIGLRQQNQNKLKIESDKLGIEIAKLQNSLERSQSSYHDQSKERAAIQDRILKTFQSVDQVYATYSVRHGAELQIEMQLPWEEKVGELALLNPHLTVKALPIEKSQILLTEFDRASALSSMSPIIGRGIPNTSIQLDNQVNQPGPINPHGNILFLPAINLSLSVLGTCNFYDTHSGAIHEDIKRAFIGSFSSVVAYTYYTKDNFDYLLRTQIHTTIDKLADHFLGNPRLTIEKNERFLDTWFDEFSIENYGGRQLEFFRTDKKFNVLKTFAEYFARQTTEFQRKSTENSGSSCAGNCESVSMLGKLSPKQITEIRNNLKVKYANRIYEEESHGNSYSKQYGNFSF